ncbi:MAG: PAS domain S-box protein [Spirulinaceae cyanobacterium]
MLKPAILCVDDEVVILDSLKRLLRKAIGKGYLIEVAENGQEALELTHELMAEGYEIQVTIADYIMPKIKGDELLRRIHEISPKTMKIMLTGQADIDAVGNAIKYANLYRYIAKPWQNDDLGLTVKEAINSYLQTQKLAAQTRQLQQMNEKLIALNQEQAALISQLNENKSRLQQLLDGIPVGILVVDRAGEPSFINSRAKMLLGQGLGKAGEIQDWRSHYGIYQAQSDCFYPTPKDPITQALQGHSTTVDDMEIRSRDRVIPLEVWGTPIYNAQGEVQSAIAAFQDITDRKLAENNLRDAEQKYRGIFENAFEGIFQTTPDGHYISANQALAAIYGYNSPTELLQERNDLNSQLYVDPQRRQEFLKAIAQSGSLSNFESLVYRQDGSQVWISENAHAIRDRDGEILYYQGFIEDISDRKLAEAERERFTTELRELNHALGRFVPQEFLQFLNRDSIIDVQLGDQVQREVSVLFADIRNFTALSEQMTPAQNFEFINTYLSHMEPAIVGNQGFIDKYIGDAIMALFGQGADDAVKAGIAMLRQLALYNETLSQQNRPPVEIGIGINTGELMLGTVGSESRMDSTAIGDVVNLASRLENLNKVYNAPLLISQHTFARLDNPNDYCIRLIDRVRVKGKIEMVSMFEVFDGDPSPLREGKLATKTLFEQALLMYSLKSLGSAYNLFQQCLRLNPGDRVVQIYLERCRISQF